jgi:hypothetical protein
MAALNFVKSAHYIEGFIKQALDYGLDVDQAVGMYDNALTTTVDTLKKESADKSFIQKGKQMARIATKKTSRAISGAAAGAKDYIADKTKGGYDAAADHFKKNKGLYGAGAAGLAAGGVAGYAAGSGDEKKAAYFEGVFKQAMAYGFSEDEAFEVAKEAADKSFGKKLTQVGRIIGKKKDRFVKNVKAQGTSLVENAKKSVRGAAASAAAGVQEHALRNKSNYAKAGIGAAGLAAGYAAGKSSDKEKKAAYLEGVFKQAMAYGFSEAEAVQFAQQAEANL